MQVCKNVNSKVTVNAIFQTETPDVKGWQIHHTYFSKFILERGVFTG